MDPPTPTNKPAGGDSTKDGAKVADRKDCGALFLHNQTHSPLLHLPAEIRNKIYTYICGHRIIHKLHKPREMLLPPQLLPPQLHVANSPVPPIWLVCRQLHAETALLPLSLNTFAFSNKMRLDETAFQRWIDTMSARQRDAIGCVRVSLVSVGRIVVALGRHWKDLGIGSGGFGTDVSLAPLRRLGGLKRVEVVVYVRPREKVGVQMELSKDVVRAALGVSAEVEIVLMKISNRAVLLRWHALLG